MSQWKPVEFVSNESSFQKSVSSAPPAGWLFIPNVNQNSISVAMNPTIMPTMLNLLQENKTWKTFCLTRKLHQKFLLKYILPFTQVGSHSNFTAIYNRIFDLKTLKIIFSWWKIEWRRRLSSFRIIEKCSRLVEIISFSIDWMIFIYLFSIFRFEEKSSLWWLCRCGFRSCRCPCFDIIYQGN